MHISRVVISDFRSIFPDERGQPLTLDLATGMNALVGRNNCGKSNVLRAIALALDPKLSLDPELDLPVDRDFATPTVELTFELDDGPDELEVARLVELWLEAAGLVGQQPVRRVTVRVSYQREPDGGYRREVDLLPTARAGVAVDERDRVLEQIFSAVRVVSIASGEGLDSFLEGNFRAVLHTVLSDRLRDEVDAAARSREDYIAGIEQRLLEPLRALLGERLRHLFQEIGGLALRPDVPDIEQTLARVAVSVTDAVETPLEAKGTGVRGGVLVALLNYLADNTSQGLVFLIEEPEAFLHPAAQEDLRDTLEGIAARNDITTIVSSHSPFIASRRAEGLVIALAKDGDGRTRVEASARGDSDHAQLIGGLIRPATFEDLLRSALDVPTDAAGVLIVEGDGDAFCLRLAAQRAGRPELVADLDIRPASGASRLVLQAVVAREALRGRDVRVAVLLDNDDAGREAKKMLIGEKLSFDKKLVISYADVLPAAPGGAFPYEAEDVWPTELMQRFVDAQGQSIVAGMMRRPDDSFHYDFELAAKEQLTSFLASEVRAEDCGTWITLLEQIRERLGLPIPPPGGSVIDEHHVVDGAVLVLPGSIYLGDYEASGLVAVPPDVALSDRLSHVAFYNAGRLGPVVPAVRKLFANLSLNDNTASGLLRGSGDAARVGQFVADGLASGVLEDGQVRHVIALSSTDASDTVELASPIENTKTLRSGKAMAWIIAPREIPLAALTSGATTTTELDQFIDDTQEATP